MSAAERADELAQPDETWTLHSADSAQTGSARVYRGSRSRSAAALRHPLIVAEGFPGGHPMSYLLGILSQHRLMQRLRRRGYDLVVLSFSDGTARMQDNAGVVDAALDRAAQSSHAPMVLGGLSMGGLVGRYALTRREHEQRAHRVRSFFTIDTPHRGAYISLAAQWFVHQFGRAAPTIEAFARLLDSPANQQLSVLWLRDGAVIESPLRRQFLADLAGLGGSPRLPRCWAVASGRGDGRAALAPHLKLLDWQADASFAARLWTLPADGRHARIAEGRCAGQDCEPLDHAGTTSWEAAPGGLGRYLQIAAQAAQALRPGAVNPLPPLTCNVPTVSALDLDLAPFSPIPAAPAAGSMFHGHAYQGINRPHLHFSRATAQWLLDRLGVPA